MLTEQFKKINCVTLKNLNTQVFLDSNTTVYMYMKFKVLSIPTWLHQRLLIT